jgi:hypothetical protein
LTTKYLNYCRLHDRDGYSNQIRTDRYELIAQSQPGFDTVDIVDMYGVSSDGETTDRDVENGPTGSMLSASTKSQPELAGFANNHRCDDFPSPSAPAPVFPTSSPHMSEVTCGITSKKAEDDVVQRDLEKSYYMETGHTSAGASEGHTSAGTGVCTDGISNDPVTDDSLGSYHDDDGGGGGGGVHRGVMKINATTTILRTSSRPYSTIGNQGEAGRDSGEGDIEEGNLVRVSLSDNQTEADTVAGSPSRNIGADTDTIAFSYSNPGSRSGSALDDYSHNSTPAASMRLSSYLYMGGSWITANYRLRLLLRAYNARVHGSVFSGLRLCDCGYIYGVCRSSG